MKKRVADLIMEILYEEGIRDCFMVVGGGAMHLNNALGRHLKMRKYCNHHEQACAMAAEAYARFSGNMAAVCVTSGPGGTNTLTGVVGAWQDSLPMIVLSGQVRYETSIEVTGLPLRTRGIQEFDIIPTVKNMTKYAVRIKDPLAIKRELKKAIAIATTGRRGPVWLDIPLDIQGKQVEEDELYPCEIIEESGPILKEESIETLINLLKSSKRPCILAGSGIISSHLQEAFLAFCNQIAIPIVGGAWISDILYEEHPLFYGLSGNIGPRVGNFILQNADFILVLGNSLSFRQTGFSQENFAPYAKIIMVDIDENEGKKPGLNVYQFIHADLKDFFKVMSGWKVLYELDYQWKRYCNHLKVRFTAFEGLSTDEKGVGAYNFWYEVRSLEPEDSIFILGNNTASSVKLQIGVQKPKQRVITNYTCGSMGYDLPAAIGTAIASGKEVICVTGDGSIMMNLQELQTIIHYDLPVKIVIFSNEGYGAIRQTCKNFFDSYYVGCTKESGISFPDFKDIAATFKMPYKCCYTNKEIRSCLEWLFNYKGRAILEVKQRLDDPIVPKLMSRLDKEGGFKTPALQDMAPFLDEKELNFLQLW